jgi:hypothetical protein
MKTFRLHLALGALAIVVTFASCYSDHCSGFNTSHKIRQLSMFQKTPKEFYFDGDTSTLVLKKSWYEKSKPYENSCGEIFFADCDCIRTLDVQYLLNDTLFFSEGITIYTSDANLETEKSRLTFGYSISTQASVQYRLSNHPDSVKRFIAGHVQSMVVVNGTQFENVFDLQFPDNPIVSRVLIKKNVGLVAILYREELFVLRQ